jgi:hypothetical protein
VIRDVHRQGGVVIAAHPVKRYWPTFEAAIEGIDGAEVMHTIAWAKGDGWRWELARRARSGPAPTSSQRIISALRRALRSVRRPTLGKREKSASA